MAILFDKDLLSESLPSMLLPLAAPVIVLGLLAFSVPYGSEDTSSVAPSALIHGPLTTERIDIHVTGKMPVGDWRTEIVPVPEKSSWQRLKVNFTP